MSVDFSTLNVGDEIPSLDKSPISRTTLALFAGASGDHNPIHLDTDIAKKAGMDDVFAQGMLSMAYLAQVLTNWVPQSSIRSYGVRFGSITHLNNKIKCTAKIYEKFTKNNINFIKLELQASDQHGDVKLSGQAVIAL